MTLPRGNTHQAEVLRYIHDEHHGHLVDPGGITARIWHDLGQKAGKHFGSVSATLSELERRGSLITEWTKNLRTEVVIIEEPPDGEVEYKERQRACHHTGGEDLTDDPGRYPTPEEVARELLRLTIRASQVPVSDIDAMQRHILCLQEELDGWVVYAAELEAKPTTDEGQLERAASAAARLAEELAQASAERATAVAMQQSLEQRLVSQAREHERQMDIKKGEVKRQREELQELRLERQRLLDATDELRRIAHIAANTGRGALSELLDGELFASLNNISRSLKRGEEV